jgi:hypothetical protein
MVIYLAHTGHFLINGIHYFPHVLHFSCDALNYMHPYRGPMFILVAYAYEPE